MAKAIFYSLAVKYCFATRIKKFRSSRHRVISSISICLLLVNNFRELTTQCDEAEVHTKVHEGMLGKKPSPWQESISRPSNHLLEGLPTELWVTHIVSRTYTWGSHRTSHLKRTQVTNQSKAKYLHIASN